MIRTAQQSGRVAYDLGENISGIGVALAMALIGTVIALSPSYVGLAWASVPFDLVLSLAVSFWFWSFMGFAVELSEIRKFVSGINEEGWENFLYASLFLVPAGAFYAGVRLFEFSVWIEMPVKLASIFLCLPGALMLAASLDFFFVQPQLKRLTQSRSDRRGRREGPRERNPALGSVATVITWMLANAANLLVILDQLFPGRTS